VAAELLDCRFGSELAAGDCVAIAGRLINMLISRSAPISPGVASSE
jgi:hypothetical protein